MTKKLLLAYKGNRCAVCGISVSEMLERYGTFKRMTEFHHIDPKKKDKNYSNLIRRKICSEQLAELDKCVLLCSQCHAIVHAQDIGFSVTLSLTHEGKDYSQTVQGQLVVDYKSKKMTFITDDRIKLHRYVIKLGKSDPRMIVGLEMEPVEFFSNLLRNLESQSPVIIWDEKMKEALFRMESIGNGDFKLQHSLKFPLLNYESSDNLPKFWVKNGVYIGEDGTLHEKGKIEVTGTIDFIA